MIKAEIKRHKNIRFADLAESMLGSDGNPLPDIFRTDGLHLNEKGYAIWRHNMKRFLR